jgi:hypothetical protein
VNRSAAGSLPWGVLMPTARLTLGSTLLASFVLLSGCQIEQVGEPPNLNDSVPTPTTGTVAGTVRDLDVPSRFVVGATVTVGGKSGNTGSIGDYLIQYVPKGSQTVTATATGYDSYSGAVEVVASSAARKDFSMARTVQEAVLVAVADAYTNSAAPTTNYGSDLGLRTGRVNLVGTPDYTSFVRFDVSGIPRLATILDATLTLYPGNTGAPSGPTGYTTVYRVAGPSWTESGTTYQNQPSPFLTPLWTTQVTFVAGPAVTFYVDDAVEAWVNEGNPNYGFMLKTGNISTTYDYAVFYSREASGNYVLLTIRYLNP